MNFPGSIKVYELSSRGALVRYLKKNFNNLYLSEYFDNTPPGSVKNGVVCQDVQKLTYGDNSFDLITSTEVFEHVADDIQGFSEVYRVLKENGYFIFTVPFSGMEKTVERAFRKDDGTIEHILEPEYHGDRVRGNNRVLTYRNYGIDVIDRLNKTGFSAEIKLINSSKNCINSKYVIIAKK